MRMYIILGIVLAILTLWLGWTFFASGNLETPNYTVLETRDDFDIRQYESYIVAEVTVAGTYDQALNQGFRILAGYIFGGNVSRESVAMTAPVTENDAEKIAMTAPVTEQINEKIAMTAPVTESQGETTRTVGFTMPSKFTLETLPIPNDDRVQFREVPPTKRAVTTFSWFAPSERIERKKAELLDAVITDDLSPLSPPTYAAFNDPWSFPLLKKHEIWVDIE
ncbi:MAG: heme-binding protein [Patescibacteria group bacterium]